MNVMDEDGTVVGDYFAELWIENTLIVELKAVKALDEAHSAQLLSHLKTSGVRHGMLMNFGSPRFEVKTYNL